MTGISPAMLALLKPQVKLALEQLLASAPPRTVAQKLAPHIEQLVDPGRGHELELLLVELAVELGRRRSIRIQER